MSKSEVLKEQILNQYHSVRKFAMEMDIPYSTINSALEKGIEGMAYGTVLRMCEKLRLNPIDFSPMDLTNPLSRPILESKIINEYLHLNKFGRKKVLEYMDDMLQIEKYTE